ncbi:sulfotransferase [Streptomyces sp. NPDC047028]|uniref:sulfotransferase family protein n=1 Tax=Streptomyces sp. NPDC047028 TaxID=3155793 RepID=UPI0033F4E9B1
MQTSASSLTVDVLRHRALDELRLANAEFQFLDGLEALLNTLREDPQLTPQAAETRAATLVERLVLQERMKQKERMHPEIKDVGIPDPLYIMGLPRTGTTLLHNLMAQHSGLHAPALWELMFPTDPHGQRSHCPERLRTEAGQRMLRRERKFPKAMAAHYMNADRPDECRILMERSFRSMVDANQLRDARYQRWIVGSDMAGPLQYHRRQLQHILWRIPGPRPVLKDIYHMWFLPEVLQVYTDARIVILHRDPLECIPSAISHSLLYRSHPPTKREMARICDRWVHLLAEGTARMMAARSSLAPDQFLDVAYPQLLADPMLTVERVADFAGLVTTAADIQLASWYLAENPQGGRGQHNYTLEELGLTRQGINHAFADYRERFGAWAV